MPAVYPSSVFNFLFLTCPFPRRRRVSPSPLPLVLIYVRLSTVRRAAQTPEKRTSARQTLGRIRLVKRLAGSFLLNASKKILTFFPRSRSFCLSVIYKRVLQTVDNRIGDSPTCDNKLKGKNKICSFNEFGSGFLFHFFSFEPHF